MDRCRPIPHCPHAIRLDGTIPHPHCSPHGSEFLLWNREHAHIRACEYHVDRIHAEARSERYRAEQFRAQYFQFHRCGCGGSSDQGCGEWVVDDDIGDLEFGYGVRGAVGDEDVEWQVEGEDGGGFGLNTSRHCSMC
jgi:hypothetical protein